MSISPVSTAKVQTCPHGLSPGACPICNPMGGGGGSRKKADPAPKNEMSYGEMYAIWMRMKAADKRKLKKVLIFINNFIILVLLYKIKIL